MLGDLALLALLIVTLAYPASFGWNLGKLHASRYYIRNQTKTNG